MIGFLNELDTRIFIFLNSLHNDSWDAFFLWATEKYTWIFLYVVILALLAWRYMQLKITFNKEEEVNRRFSISYQKKYLPWLLLSIIFVAFTVAIADQVSVHLFKNLFMRLRPSHVADLADFIHLPRTKGGMYGFVSSHATTSFAVAYFTSRIIGLRWYTWIIFSWAVMFSYSRIYIGVHYPGDSIFGALLGLFIAWLLLRTWVSMGKEWFPPLLPSNLQH